MENILQVWLYFTYKQTPKNRKKKNIFNFFFQNKRNVRFNNYGNKPLNLY